MRKKVSGKYKLNLTRSMLNQKFTCKQTNCHSSRLHVQCYLITTEKQTIGRNALKFKKSALADVSVIRRMHTLNFQIISLIYGL